MKNNNKNQIITPKKSNVTKFRNSISFTSMSNHQFVYLGNQNSKIGMEFDKSSSNSSSNNIVFVKL